MFITFEGTEGCGKSTQIDLLAAWLQDKGHEVVKTREPGGTGVGEALRTLILQKGVRVLPISELLVFMAIRAQHMEEVILPALSAGKIVLCDRFADATTAYQGYGRGLDLDVISTLNRLVTKGIMPDLTVLIDCDVATGLRRRAADSPQLDRFEDEEVAFHESIRSGYHKLAEGDPTRFFVIDGEETIEEIWTAIEGKVTALLEAHGV
jgi:dTMP kinase